MAAKKTSTITVVRDSRTGRFVEPKQAQLRPATTEKENYTKASVKRR